MKRILIYILLLLLGGIVGFLISNNIQKPDKPITETVEVVVEKVKEKVIRDTVVVKEIINNEVSLEETSETDTIESIDTTDLAQDNALINDEIDVDFSLEEDNEDNDEKIVINKDELISKRSITVQQMISDTLDPSELLEMNANAFGSEMLVEFWQSPLNITGYELTRNNLKLFGFNPKEKISLIYNVETSKLLLNTETMSIILEKSNHFQPLNLK